MYLRSSSGLVAAVLTGLLIMPAGPASAGGGRALLVDDDGAQCPGAAFTQIQPAIDAAQAGDTVRVCGGSYTGDLTIPQGVNVVAKTPAAPAVDCLTAAPSYAAPLAVVHGALTMTGANALVDGLVVTDAPTGISTGDQGSELQQSRRNLITGDSDFGIELESNGRHQPVVENNCITSNPAGGIVSEAGALRRATVRSNTVARTIEGITTLGPHPHYDIAITDNTIRLANFGIYVSGTVGSGITANYINLADPPKPIVGAGVGIGGGNIGLNITFNTIRDVFGTAVYAQREGGGAVHPEDDILGSWWPATPCGTASARVCGWRSPRAGRPANLTSSLIYRNSADHSSVNGFAVTAGNDGNILLANTSTDNGRYGIALLGAINTSCGREFDELERSELTPMTTRATEPQVGSPTPASPTNRPAQSATHPHPYHESTN